MADGPTLRPKSTGQQWLPCPEMKWKMEMDDVLYKLTLKLTIILE